MHPKDAELIRADGGSAAFEPLALLGEGRTAEVYLVRDARPEREQIPLQLRIAAVTHQMPETYALKIALDAPGEPLAARNARVSGEQETLECLVHPGIVRSGTGGWHEGRAFFSMELLEGPGLPRFLSHGRRSYREHMRLVLGVSEAVARCHARGVVHRDLRPSNFTVEPDRGPVLFDFESSTPIGEECSEVAVGAAEYASPEYLAYVLDPSLTYVNHPRGDVYALGVFLNTLMTGQQRVVQGSGDVEDYLLALRDARPVSPLLINPEMPPACAALTLRLLSRDRPANALEVPQLIREALLENSAELDRLAPSYTADTETLLSTVRLPARRRVSGRWRAARRTLRRRALDLTATAFVSIVVCVIGSVMFRLHARPAMDARLAESDRATAEKHAAMARPDTQVQAQLASATNQPPAALRAIAISGLKMPKQPDPRWLKPRADGNCYSFLTGEMMQGAIALRGACWGSGLKVDPKAPCNKTLYDAPPEVDTDPKLQYLRNHCFDPVYAPEPQAAK